MSAMEHYDCARRLLGAILTAKQCWGVAWRSWRSEQRATAFPSEVIVMSKVGGRSNYCPVEVDWIRIA